MTWTQEVSQKYLRNTPSPQMNSIKGVMTHTCNFSTQKAQTGGFPWVQGQPQTRMNRTDEVMHTFDPSRDSSARSISPTLEVQVCHHRGSQQPLLFNPKTEHLLNVGLVLTAPAHCLTLDFCYLLSTGFLGLGDRILGNPGCKHSTIE